MKGMALIIGLVSAIAGAGCVSMEQWRRDHCNYDGAYADGMNEARQGYPMNPQQFVGQCPIEIEAEVMDGYREGYSAGALAGPLPARAGRGGHARSHDEGPAPTHAAPAPTGQWACQNTLDCRDRGFCKDRGDGVKLCMKDGARGDYCTSTIDCGSGLWCKEGPGGLEICM